MPETATRAYTSAAAGSLLVELRTMDPDTLLSARDLAEVAECERRATQRWIRKLGVPRANVPGVTPLYRAGDLAAAITGAR